MTDAPSAATPSSSGASSSGQPSSGEPTSGAGPILVTGGTGTLGRAVVRTLLDAGRTVRVLSRHDRTPQAPAAEWAIGDLTTGEGIPEALAGVSTVIHCATDSRRPSRDVDAAVHLLLAARATAVPHLVYISIVGVDSVPLGYYQLKHQVEELVEEGGVPWTILRATQFHDLVAKLFKVLSGGPVFAVPADMSIQPVDVRDVAVRLIELALGAPSGRVADFGGPEVLTTVELADQYLEVTGRRRKIWAAPLGGKVLAGYRSGGHLAPDHADGRRTFAAYLAERAGR